MEKEKQKLSKAIKAFVMMHFKININVDLFIAKIAIQIPDENRDWFNFYIRLLGHFSIVLSCAYGLGWHVGFYKDHISIHMKRVYFLFQWWSSDILTHLKLDWLMCRKDPKTIKRDIEKLLNAFPNDN